MPITRMGDFSFNHADQQDDLYNVYNSAQIKEKFDSRGEELRAVINNVIDTLNSSTDGNSGADNVSATGFDGNPNTVQVMLEDLNTRKVDVTGDFQGTLNGNPIVAAEPGLSSEVANARGGFTNLREKLDSFAVNVKDFGAKGDGVTDDTDALIATRDYIIENGGIFYIPEDMNCYISGNLDLTGIRYVNVKGKITGSVSTNTITFGGNSNIGHSSEYYVNEARTIIVKFHGLMNAEITVQRADHVLIFADGNDDTKDSFAYCQLWLGRVDKLELNSTGGTYPAWINENKFYGGRIMNLFIGGAYPHSNNIFYGTMFENFTANIDNGKYNHFYDCRLEGTINITFGPGTQHNYFYRSHYTTDHNYLQGLEINVTNNGLDNGVISTLDSAHRREIIYEINPRSKNFSLDIFTKNEYDLTVKTSFQDFYDTGLVELNNPMGFLFRSDQQLFNVYLYAYDENKNLLTTAQPGFTALLGGSFDTNNYYYSFSGALIKETGFPVYPTSTVKYFRIRFRTGGTAGSTFKYVRLIKIEQNSKWTTIIPVTHSDNYYSSAKPNAGTWKKGDYVKNSNPSILGTSGSQYIVRGWVRLTDGTGHILNTDWVEDRALTGS